MKTNKTEILPAFLSCTLTLICHIDYNFTCITVSTAVTYDKSFKAIRVKVPDSDEEFYLHPATVRRNDRSAQSVVYMLMNSQTLKHSTVISWHTPG